MKTTRFMKGISRYGVIFTLVLIFSACEKNDEIQTFNDVFDTSGVKALNEKISDPESLIALNDEFAKVNMNIANALENITLDEMLAHLNQSIKLSNTEIDLLLKNDSKTYLDVINRFGSLPGQMESIDADDFESIKSSSLNKYLLKVKAEPENFYSTDYYTAILEMQRYIKAEVIEPMDLLKKGVKTIPPGNGVPPTDATILYYKIISLNNVWDMWWTYWSDGTRTKHKGAAGSFPG
jgi:hypothetical protein